jgi:hypothetical protein
VIMRSASLNTSGGALAKKDLLKLKISMNTVQNCTRYVHASLFVRIIFLLS